MADFDFSKLEMTGALGLDTILGGKPAATVKKASGRVKVGSLAQLEGLERVARETLVNTSTRDLWTIQKDGSDYYIQRLFDDDGNPQKG